LPAKAYIGGVVLDSSISGSSRRIFEICNILFQRKYKVVLFTYDGVPPDWIKVNTALRPIDYLEFEYPDVLISPDYLNYNVIKDFDAKLKIVFLHNSLFLKKYLEIAKNPRTLIFTMNEKIVSKFPKEKVVYFPFGVNADLFAYNIPENTNGAIKKITFIVPNTKYIYDYYAFIMQIYEQLKNPFLTFSILTTGSNLKLSSSPFTISNSIDTNTLIALYRNTYLAIDLRYGLDWNNCVLELLSVGRPVICFPDGTSCFAKHFYNSFTISTYDVEYLCGLISLFVNDKCFYNYISRNTQTGIGNFSYYKGVEKVEEVFKSYGIV
jgi:hypothetical protein